MSTANAPFGNLSKLPPEIRIQIWWLLVTEFQNVEVRKKRADSYIRWTAENSEECQSRSITVLPLLLVNQAVSQEISAELYRARVLSFFINLKDWPWTSFVNLDGKKTINFYRFKKLRIVIYPPRAMSYLFPDVTTYLDHLIGNQVFLLDTAFNNSFYSEAKKRDGAGLGLPERHTIELSFINDETSYWCDFDLNDASGIRKTLLQKFEGQGQRNKYVLSQPA